MLAYEVNAVGPTLVIKVYHDFNLYLLVFSSETINLTTLFVGELPDWNDNETLKLVWLTSTSILFWPAHVATS